MLQPNYRITEEVIDLEIANGQSMGNLAVATDSDGSEVFEVVIFYNGTADTPIMAGITVEGNDVSKMQHIDNYRSRDCAYLSNKPCYFESGKKVDFKVRTAGEFTSDFTAQLILIKRKACL